MQPSHLPVYRAVYDLWYKAKQRAEKAGLEFNLTREYIKYLLVEKCPILNKILVYGAKRNSNRDYSATLDRINVDKGYIEGNVWIISNLANMMKSSSRYWHRVLFANWTIETVLENQSHIRYFDFHLVEQLYHNLKRLNDETPKMEGAEANPGRLQLVN